MVPRRSSDEVDTFVAVLELAARERLGVERLAQLVRASTKTGALPSRALAAWAAEFFHGGKRAENAADRRAPLNESEQEAHDEQHEQHGHDGQRAA